MRTMSWSRYHTFTRIPTHLRSRGAKRMRRAAKTATKTAIKAATSATQDSATQDSATQDSATQDSATQDSAARSEPERQSGDTPRGFTGGFPSGISQFLTRIFRTGRLRNRTDI
jgi:hypothetical protein